MWLSDTHGYLRADVRRDTTVDRLRQAAAQHVGLPAASVTLSMDGEELQDGQTVEEIGLFSQEGKVVVRIDDGPAEQ